MISAQRHTMMTQTSFLIVKHKLYVYTPRRKIRKNDRYHCINNNKCLFLLLSIIGKIIFATYFLFISFRIVGVYLMSDCNDQPDKNQFPFVFFHNQSSSHNRQTIHK